MNRRNSFVPIGEKYKIKYNIPKKLKRVKNDDSMSFSIDNSIKGASDLSSSGTETSYVAELEDN